MLSEMKARLNLFKQRGRQDLEAAILEIEKLERSTDRAGALFAAFSGAAESNPSGAFLHLESITGVDENYYRELFGIWSKNDPKAATRAAVKVDRPAFRMAALKAVGQEWAKHAPDEALAWLEGSEFTDFERAMIRSSVHMGHAEHDPKAAMKQLATGDIATQNRLLPGSLQLLADRSPLEAIDWIRADSDSFIKHKGLRQPLHQIARNAPVEALQLAKDFPDLQEQLVMGAIDALGENDVQAATKALLEFRDDHHYASILMTLAENISFQQPDQAHARAKSLPEADRAMALGVIANNTATFDPELAISSLAQLNTPETQKDYLTAVKAAVGAWGINDPLGAVKWLETLPDENVKNQGISSVAVQVATSDPVAASKMLKALPPGSARSSGMIKVAETWMKVDPVGASKWIVQLPDGSDKNMAAMALGRHIADDDPAAAIAWFESMTDAAYRNTQLRMAYKNWYQRDPTGALESLEKSSLPDEIKLSIIKPAPAQGLPPGFTPPPGFEIPR